MDTPGLAMDYVNYAGMNAGVLAYWILICTFAGFLARQILRGPKLFGLWGDLVIGVIGVFLAGAAFRAIGVDPSQYAIQFNPTWGSALAIWIDVAVTALLGALVLRLPLMLARRGG